ncbi:MAG: hypothetical protein CVV42_07815 [Candidatus Riflebacteria bacterium HGW-Riflebacteria-2]|jgi:hypothetical protein|nr:MAG: hypothetical protein CVV42_07815 [Candidatus Riflebacteria bacterium HGW-Riflebacteria-2]
MAKRTIPFLIAFLFIVVISSKAQQKNIIFHDNRAYVTFEGIDDWEIKPVQIGDKYGFEGKNASQGIFMLPDKARSFSEDLAAVCLDGRWGYISNTGKLKIPYRYDEAQSFASGTAIVVVNKRYGLINKKGNYSIKPKYSFLSRTDNPDMFFVFDDWKAGIIHRTKGMILSPGYSELSLECNEVILASKDNKQGLFDYRGKVILPMTDAPIKARGKFILIPSKEEFSPVFEYKKNKLVKSGRVKNFISSDLAPFQDSKGNWGFMNSQLQLTIPAIYSWVTEFDSGEAAVDGHNGIEIIDLIGQPIANPKTTRNLYNTLGWQRVSFQGRQGIQDSDGVWVTRPDYLDFKIFSTGTSLAKHESAGKELWVLLTAEKDPTRRPTFSEVGEIHQDRCWVKSNGKFSFLNEQGLMINSQSYEEVTEMERGIAAVRKGTLWGFINRDGKQLQPHIYTKIVPKGNSHFLVFEGKKSGLINSKGEYLKAEQDIYPAEAIDKTPPKFGNK